MNEGLLRHICVVKALLCCKSEICVRKDFAVCQLFVANLLFRSY